MTDDACKYRAYILQGFHPSVFGETYVIVTATKDARGKYDAEYFILMQRPSKTLMLKAFEDVGNPNLIDIGPVVDLDIALAFALNEAEHHLFLLLEKRAAELNDSDLADLPFRWAPFVGWRMRGRFTDQLMEIKDSTKCTSLARPLSLLEQVRTIRRAN
jgi:hypothetical protein